MAVETRQEEMGDDVLEYQKIAQQEAVDKEQFLTFHISSEDYGIELVQAKEVIKVPQITNVPHTEEYVLGVINLRGQIVPVINLKKKLDLEEKGKVHSEAKRIIVVQNDDSLVGIMVDSIKEVLSINQEKIQQMAESERGISREYIEGIFNNGENLVIILDITEVLFEDRNINNPESEIA